MDPGGLKERYHHHELGIELLLSTGSRAVWHPGIQVNAQSVVLADWPTLIISSLGHMSRAELAFHLRCHLSITYEATVPACARGFHYFAFALAEADWRISAIDFRAPSYDHLPSYHMKGDLKRGSYETRAGSNGGKGKEPLFLRPRCISHLHRLCLCLFEAR